jgi:hypothetical protein
VADNAVETALYGRELIMKKIGVALILIAMVSGVLVGIARIRKPRFTGHKIEYKITAYDEQGREADVSYLVRTRASDGTWQNHQTMSDGTTRDMKGQAPYPTGFSNSPVIDTICKYGVSRSVIDKGSAGNAEVYFSPDLGENLKTILLSSDGKLINVSEAIRVDPGE